jgi:LruC domain-containing protein
MKRYIFFGIFITLLITSFSCRRELSDVNKNNKEVASMQDLVVPTDFSWENSIQVEVIVSLHSTKAYHPKHKVSVYKSNSEPGTGLLTSGSLTAGSSFTDNLSIPAYIEELTLVCENPYGSVITEIVPVEAGLVSHTFSFENNTPQKNSFNYKGTQDGPDCGEDCDEYISGGGTVNVGGGLTYCIIDDFDGKINFQNWNGGATLQICGSAKITNNQYLESNVHIIVAEGGYLHLNKDVQLAGASITIYQGAEVVLGALDLGNNATFTVYENAVVDVKKFNGWGSNSPLTNYGNITVQENSYHRSSIENFGSMVYKNNLELDATSLFNGVYLEVQKKFQCYGSGSTMINDGLFTVSEDFEYGNNTLFTNNGTVEADDDFKIYNNASLINNGTITVAKDCDISSGGDFINNCQFVSAESIDFAGEIKIVFNTGYLKAGDELNFWINKSVDLFDNCMIVAEKLELGNDMNGEGGLSTVMVTDELNVWNSSDKFGGTIEVATTDGEMNGGGVQNFINGAYLTSIDEAVNYLPVTACNPDGFGTPSVVDMDFDGIPDTIDDFPNDPLRAFISYFPDDVDYATVAFEDLWPSKGDYDFNDLVVAVYGSEVTNADDDLVDLTFNFVVLAVGASLDNGFAFQLESITPDMVASVTGSVLDRGYTSIASNGVENGQSKAVIIVTESINDIIHRPGGSFFNTVEGNPQGTSDTIQTVITFNEPVDRQLFGFEVFNPFIIKNQNRNVEIHLANFPPTDLMDMELFGTGDDVSNPVAGVYYTTATNLPWGLFLLEPFDYPNEESQILDAYNHFDTWAESGGSIYSDWYLNYSGYRNTNAIY